MTTEERQVIYTPLGESEELTLTIGTVRNFIAAKTKQGKTPSDEDIVKFMMLCKARNLNPWVGDAYLVGYDGNDGPRFSLITSIQALYKRAEMSPEFDGIQSGLILGSGAEVEGTFESKDITGGWCNVYRKDRAHPFVAKVRRDVYDTKRSYWAKDPGFMIAKCAEAAALRKAFPNQLAGLYLSEEINEQASGAIQKESQPKVTLEQIEAGIGK